MDIIDGEFKKRYPNLAKELEEEKMRIRIDSARTETTNEAKDSGALRGYIPDIVDFIRRCDNIEEAKEIINFLEKHCEISQEYAIKLRTQLLEKGLRSFGSKKEEGYYFKQRKV